MAVKFEIPGRLPGRNDSENAARTHWSVGANLKMKATKECAYHSMKIKPISKPVYIKITWIEPNLKRDLDNICGGIKYILDGLVMSGRLKDDSRKYVKGIEHQFNEVDKNNPRIIVELNEIDDYRIGGSM